MGKINLLNSQLMKSLKKPEIFLLLISIILNLLLGLNLIGLHNRLNEDMKSFNYVAQEDFNRGDLIRRVESGDAEAAFELGRYYGTKGITEAQLYWFKLAKKLGHT